MKKNIIIIILTFLLLVSVIKQNVDVNENKNENLSENTIKKDISLVVPQLEKKESKGKSACDNQELYINATLPKINIETEVTKKINQEILNIYNLKKNEQEGSPDYDIYYTYQVIPKENIVFINIIMHHKAHCSIKGVYYKQYLYDYKNDKLLNLDDLLKIYNISKERMIELAYSTFGYTSLKEEYKKLIPEYIKTDKLRIINIGDTQLYFGINFDFKHILYFSAY